MNKNNTINYVEFPAKDLQATKRFFEKAFDWSFDDFGPDYTAFSNAGLNGGFYKANLCSSTESGAALIIFYSNELESRQEIIKRSGGNIVKEIFPFPGGRRFHFTEPSGNEFAVWSDVNIT